jgi:hypothetical protein
VRIPLGELGTHCRGALFRDGRRLVTPELEEAVDRIARATEGFFFGRFDVRAESDAGLREGRFRILELNGVTSEAAHVYEPGLSLWNAWRTLGAQWRLAFEIGAANRARGVRASNTIELARALLGDLAGRRRAARAVAREEQVA